MGKIDFHLILVTDRKLLEGVQLNKFVMRCCVYGIKAVHFREKDLASKEMLILAQKIRRAANKNFSSLFINDRLDIALLSDADGFHSPGAGIGFPEIKKFKKDLLTGKSVHTHSEAKKAETEGFDYLICGTVFKPFSKSQYAEPLGMDTFKAICSSVKIPVFAIGGINPDRTYQCMEAGAFGVASIGSIFNSENLNKTITDFKTALGGKL